MWEQKAKEIEKNSDQSKKWYANMRTRFGKIKHTSSGSARPELTSRDKWIVQRFRFRKPYLTVHNKKISYGVSSFGVSYHACHEFAQRLDQYLGTKSITLVLI